MAKRNLFPCFNVFNIIYGVTGLCIILLAVFLIIKMSFNALFFSIILIGIFMIFIMLLGFLCKKRICVIKIYMALVIISLIFFAIIGLTIEFFPDTIEKIMRNQFKIDEEGISSMNIRGHPEDFIVPYSLCGVCFIVIIATLVYYKSIADLVAKVNKENADGDPILRDLDYDMPLDSSN